MKTRRNSNRIDYAVLPDVRIIKQFRWSVVLEAAVGGAARHTKVKPNVAGCVDYVGINSIQFN